MYDSMEINYFKARAEEMRAKAKEKPDLASVYLEFAVQYENKVEDLQSRVKRAIAR